MARTVLDIPPKPGSSNITPVPTPSHRHAAPSAPWPWLDSSTSTEVSSADTDKPKCPHPEGECGGCWYGYPQSLFPNWRVDQQRKSGIRKIIQAPSGHKDKSVIYRLDMLASGVFKALEPLDFVSRSSEAFWEEVQQPRPEGTRVRALFVEDLSSTTLRMLGARYTIEPFFFSSALNWIPTRYQEALRHGHGDHMTLVLKFVSTKEIFPPQGAVTAPQSPTTTASASISRPLHPDDSIEELVIDTQKPLYLRSSSDTNIVFQDLLALHVVRSNSGSTILSYHAPPSKWNSTSAKFLCDRISVAGRSVYWQHIFRSSQDPTCMILLMLWHAFYAWDEALEVLYRHICYLESGVMSTNDPKMTHELHVIRAHILHYESLLGDFRKTIQFVEKIHNPALVNTTVPPSSSSATLLNGANDEWKDLLDKECEHMLSGVDRLEEALKMHDKRLRNVMNLTFSLVNIEDSKRMAALAEATGRDSAAMRQISSLTMIFLPASLVAAVFGMNVTEINEGSIPQFHTYLAIAIPLTIFTIWVTVALQFRSQIIASRERKQKMDQGSDLETSWEDDESLSAWSGLWWPILLGKIWMRKRRTRGTQDEKE
ncbi:Cora superfamily [Pleurotus pulmonarius]